MAIGTPNLPAGAVPGRRLDNLAIAFQEVLTAIVRLRANSQNITDAEQFRAQVRAAHTESDRRGSS